MSATAAVSLFQPPPTDLYSTVTPMLDRLRALDFSAIFGKNFSTGQIQHQQCLSSTAEAEAALDSFKRFMATQAAMGDRVMCPSAVIDGLWHTALGISRPAFDKLCQDSLGTTLFHPARTDDDRAGEAFKWTKKVMIAGGTAPSIIPGRVLLESAAGILTGGSVGSHEQILPKAAWKDRGCWVAKPTEH